MKTDINYLKQWQRAGNKVVVYCAGCVGIAIANILNRCGIRIDCFVDNNPQKWGMFILDDVKCESPSCLSGRDDCITFIGIVKKHYESIISSAQENNVLQIVDFNDILDDIIINKKELYLELIKEFENYEHANYFYTNNPNSWVNQYKKVKTDVTQRLAVYTSVFGSYDQICMPKVKPDNVDYYYISDEEPGELGCYKWIDAKTIVPDEITSPIKRNRYVKMHPHLIFPQYRYSVYVDGNIEIKDDISCFVAENKSGISTFMHPERECIFYEGLTVVNYRRAVAEEVINQLDRYLSEGMPIHYGLPEMRVIVREHMKPICIKVMEDWWKEFDTGCQRDQLSFMYVMWKNGMSLSDMTSLGRDAYSSDIINVMEHS